MAQKDMYKITIKIEDEDHFKSAVLEASENKLIIVDIHQDWCGLCEAIHPTCVRVLMDYDDADNKVTFASASVNKLGHALQASFPSDCTVNLDKNGCSPVFALYRHKACVAVLTGVDAPHFLTQIDMNIPGKSLGGE